MPLELSQTDIYLASWAKSVLQTDRLGIQKLLWFGNYASLRLYSQPLITFSFKAYIHGPFNQDLGCKFDSLEFDPEMKKYIGVEIDFLYSVVEALCQTEPSIALSGSYKMAHLTHSNHEFYDKSNSYEDAKSIKNSFIIAHKDEFCTSYFTNLCKILEKKKQQAENRLENKYEGLFKSRIKNKFSNKCLQ